MTSFLGVRVVCSLYKNTVIIQELVAEVHRIGNEVKVIVELPGVTDESLKLDMQGDRLIIDAGDADRHYHTSAMLPPVDPGSMQKSLKNGVLEITYALRSP